MEISYKTPSVEELNLLFKGLTFEQRLSRLYDYFDEEEILLTSSFGANAAFLLHLISQVRPKQQVYFIDTTYHFEETLAYKKYLAAEWKLNVIDLLPNAERNRLSKEQELWKNDPDLCCKINKVEALEPLKATHKVWLSGLMAFQTPFRAGLNIFEQDANGLIKFHPLIDMSEVLYLAYSAHYQIPEHPLQLLGYGSVGCTHCTAKGDGRAGRWQGKEKTECGLHL